ncbi:MAG: aldehyde dehydrogenase family protein [Oscillospiraceae bacterium]|jgi:acyl-CoA reductase-like NAD-dependent aldehyde dehydrogenase
MENYRMYIGGKWVDSLGGEVFEDFNPYTGNAFAKIAGGGGAEAKMAIDAARDAFPAWAAVTYREKQELFNKAAEILNRRLTDVADMLVRESGAVSFYSRFQAASGKDLLLESAVQASRMIGEILPSASEGCMSMSWRQPCGVVASISPWNAPFVLSLRAVCFPIAYGNTVVLKPSSETPISGGALIAEIFEEAGFPEGVLNVIYNGPGKSSEIGDVFTSDPRVRRISFTGSTDVGRHLAMQCGQNLKRIVLELGGSCPMIVLKDADIDYAVRAAVMGRFVHQGQICMSTKRFIVEKPVAEEFTDKLVKKVSGLKYGDPAAADTFVGPIINKSQFNKIRAQVERAIEQGARCICGNDAEGLVFKPTVLAGITEDMDIAGEEVFGPVACVISADDADDAVRLANKTSFGLSSGIITADTALAFDIAGRLEAGCSHINDCTVSDEPNAPLGGMKDSGWGRNGNAGIDEFTELRWVTYQRKERHFPV